MRCAAASNHHRLSTVERSTVFVHLPGLLVLLLAALGISGCASAPEPAAVGNELASVASPGAPLPGADPAADAALPESDPGWLARAQQGLAEREYRASENGEGLQAPNRRHNLRTYFEPSGIRVHDRTAAGSPELLSLSLVGLGRGDALAPVAPGVVTSEGARVEIRRSNLLEWYANSPAGLEQGFTLPERPHGEGALALELAVEHASASLRGERVILATPAGRRLAYGKLAVVDATGAAVVARLEVPDPGRVRLVVADAGARYPLTIDPLLTETADTQLESDQVDAYLGNSVSGAGDVNGDGYADVIVGAPDYDAGQSPEGAAFVFLGSASGIADGNPASAATQLESNQAGARLGQSVSGAGDVNGDGYSDVIVGAYTYSAGQADEGAAFVFLGNGDGDGRPVVARQLRGDASGTPVQPWGDSYDADAFEVRVQATHPAGRGRVKLEVETCEAGLAFGDVSCASQTAASWTDVTATSGGVELTETISGLTEDTLYHWRARVLHAPYSVTQIGITAPPKPAHSPWRRVSAQAQEADIRVVPEPSVTLGLAAGLTLLALLERRRRRREL